MKTQMIKFIEIPQNLLGQLCIIDILVSKYLLRQFVVIHVYFVKCGVLVWSALAQVVWNAELVLDVRESDIAFICGVLTMHISPNSISIIRICFICSFALHFLLFNNFDFLWRLKLLWYIIRLLRMRLPLQSELLRFHLCLLGLVGWCVSRWSGEVLDLGEQRYLHLLRVNSKVVVEVLLQICLVLQNGRCNPFLFDSNACW